jgi:hypothetical protein
MDFNSIHILLTYQCNYECDHCFAWGSPWQTGVFTAEQLENVFQQALALGSVREFYFEGGETFLYYPVLLQAVARATELGFATGIVTNGYWATTVEDALLWLRPLAAAGLDQIDISCDIFHGDTPEETAMHPGLVAARQLGLAEGAISIEPPTGYRDPDTSVPGEAISGGDVMYRGRAAEKLAPGLPTQPWDSFTTCPYENLVNPGRIHLDPLGNLHMCQGLVIGNLFERPLAQITAEYDPKAHPVIGPLLAGGPAQLVREYHVAHEVGYVDACHLCYSAREHLRPRFAAELAPNQMYGVMGAD